MICSILPIAILKNGIRIVTLSALAIYVDEKFITQSFLHKSGGFVFFLPALGILGLILWGLRRTEVEDRGTRETKEGGHGDTEARR